MNSEEWQAQIDGTAAEIGRKELRLAEIGREKAAVISDVPKLAALEAEELTLPAVIESLKKRLPLLAHAHEGTLKIEAEARHRELEQRIAAAANQVSTSTVKIRDAMQSLLACISEAHDTWDDYGLLQAEADYLQMRFTLHAIQIPPRSHLTPEEEHGFVAQFRLRLRHAPNRQPWEGLRAEWQEAARRQESQRRAEEDKALAAGPRANPYRHLSKTYA